MSLDILEAARRIFPDSLITKTAMSLGESETNIRKALKGAIPAILAGLLHQSSRREGLGIIDLLKNVESSDATNNLPGILESTKNSALATTGQETNVNALIPGWLKSIFDGKLINIINAISVYADVKSSSANAILKIATPAALTPVARYAKENNMGAADIDMYLHSQKSSLIAAVPAGFNLTGSLGINSLEDIGTKIVTSQPKPSEYQQRKAIKNTAGKWVWPLLLLVTFGGLIWFFSKRSTSGPDATNTSLDTTKVPVKIVPSDTLSLPQIWGKLDSITGNYIYDQGAEIELKLADSSLLRVGKYSTEARLFKMLSDSRWSVDSLDKTKNWISFDRVYFETGKAMLTPESQVQVKNIVAILKNFPAGSIKVGGYTDNTGDSVINKKISGERAGMVMRELIKHGVTSNQIIEAVGYGAEHPVCPANDTPECKARNRRVDLKVASK